MRAELVNYRPSNSFVSLKRYTHSFGAFLTRYNYMIPCRRTFHASLSLSLPGVSRAPILKNTMRTYYYYYHHHHRTIIYATSRMMARDRNRFHADFFPPPTLNVVYPCVTREISNFAHRPQGWSPTTTSYVFTQV